MRKGRRQSRKVKKEQKRERFVAAMRREAMGEEEGGGGGRGRERLKMTWKEMEKKHEEDRESEAEGDKGMRGDEARGIEERVKSKSCWNVLQSYITPPCAARNSGIVENAVNWAY